ncbi:MAG: hypothetical protein ABI040_08950 [Rhodoferax sp.]
MTSASGASDRAIRVASVLRPLGKDPLTREQALAASKLLGVHWTHGYRLRRGFLASPVASSVAPGKKGRKTGMRLNPQIESIVQASLHLWMRRQRQLAHPLP